MNERQPRPSLTLLVEMCVNISMTFQDADDLEHVSNIAEEDHISSKSEASHIRPELGPWSAHLSWKAAKMTTLMAQGIDELLPDGQ